VWIREELERREQAEKEAKGGKKNMRKRKRTNSSGGGMTGRCDEGSEDHYGPMRERGGRNDEETDSDRQMVIRGGSGGDDGEAMEGLETQGEKQSTYMPIYDKWCGETEQGRPGPRPGRIWVRS
jgi:hypothetical protein